MTSAAAMNVHASVKVRVIEGKQIFSDRDPYVVVKVRNENKNTHPVKKGPTPMWDCSFVFVVENPETDVFTIQLWEKHMIQKDVYLGACSLPLSGLVMGLERISWLPLEGTKGELRVGLTAVGFDTRMLAHPQQPSNAEVGFADVTQQSVSLLPPSYEVTDPNHYYAKASTKHSAGSLQLFLNKPYYLEGETILGHVILNLNVSQSTKGVFLKFYGQEKVKVYHETNTWVQRGDTRELEHRETSHEMKEKLFEHHLTLQGPGYYQPGQYVFPIPPIQLPNNLPGVFYDRVGMHKGKTGAPYINKYGVGGIRYVMKVNLDIPGSDIKLKESLIISERVTQKVIPLTETQIKTFMMYSGQMRITADVGKNVFTPGETLPIRVRIDNPTKKDVASIKVKLWRKTILGKGMHMTDMIKEVYRQKYPGSPPLNNMDQVVSFVIPPDIPPSTNGKYVNCVYTLDVEADFSMAIDTNFQNKVVIALLPAPDVPMQLHADYTHSWHW